jgi:splicing factor 3B subunit 3
MHFFSLNLQRAGAINQAIYGNFSAAKAQEVVVARGTILELLRPDETTGKLISVASVNTFSVLRSLAPFRLPGASRDYIIVGSDSGKLTILEFGPTAVAAAGSAGGGAGAGGAITSGSGAAGEAFRVVKSETFGKTGCRRAVPGQYLACDPKGRAMMVAAVEKQKLVYVMNRDASNRLTVSSPLECHRANTITYSVVGVDVHFDNPVWQEATILRSK